MVRIECRSCGHKVELDPTRLYWFFLKRGWPTQLHRAQKHFRCSECDQKRVAIYPGGLVK